MSGRTEALGLDAHGLAGRVVVNEIHAECIAIARVEWETDTGFLRDDGLRGIGRSADEALADLRRRLRRLCNALDAHDARINRPAARPNAGAAS